MYLYLLIMLLSILLLGVKNKNVKSIGCNILLAFMAFLCVFRGEDVGIDTVNYKDIFDSGYRLAYYLIKDPLYGVLGTCIYNWGLSYEVFQILMGVMTYIPLFIVLNKRSDNIAISILIFF